MSELHYNISFEPAGHACELACLTISADDGQVIGQAYGEFAEVLSAILQDAHKVMADHEERNQAAIEGRNKGQWTPEQIAEALAQYESNQ